MSAFDPFIASVGRLLEAKELISEDEQNTLLDQLDAAFPNADMEDLVYSPHTRLDAQHIVNEAAYREQLWSKGGRKAVRDRIKGQMTDAIENPASPMEILLAARVILSEIDREEKREN